MAKIRLCSLILFVLVLAASSADACTAMLVGRKASATGRVLVAHNEDMSGCFIRHAFLPRHDGRPAIFWSEIKRRKGDDVCAHFFFNEWGVVVCSNNGGVMPEWDGETFALPDEGEYSTVTDGGIGYELRIRAIEGAKTARTCVERMAALVEQYGYNQTSRNFMVADANEAWVFMALNGRRYMARRVPDDKVVAYPNCLVFSRLQPGDIASKNIREKGPDFDLIAYYQGPRTWKSPYNLHRWQDFYRLSAGVDVSAGEEYPFGVTPAHPVSVDDIKKGLCSHYEGRPYEVMARHPDKDPKIVAPICRQTTQEALVCSFAARPEETELHMTVGRPCEVPYRVYRPFAGVLPHDTAFGAKALARLENRKLPPADCVKVAVYVGRGPRGNGCAEWLRLLASSPEVELALLDSKLVGEGELAKAEVLVVPGGDSRTIKKDIGPEGAERIRAFVRAGGGYIGTCAGCCLAMDEKAEPERGIGLMPYRRIGNKGHHMMPVAINERGAAALGLAAGVREIRYSKGPVLEPVEPASADMRFETWGTYAGDTSDDGLAVSMRDRVAIVGGTLGKGRVFAIACHPESFACTRDIVRGAFRFVTGREVSFPARPRALRALTVGYLSNTRHGVTSAQEILRLDAEPGVDLIPVADDEINFNMLDHVDVLVLPDGVPAWYARVGTLLSEGLADFVSRGGKSYAWGEGVKYLPEGGRAFDSPTGVLNAIADLAK